MKWTSKRDDGRWLLRIIYVTRAFQLDVYYNIRNVDEINSGQSQEPRYWMYIIICMTHLKNIFKKKDLYYVEGIYEVWPSYCYDFLWM